MLLRASLCSVFLCAPSLLLPALATDTAQLASVADGQADATAVLQAAINAGSGLVELPAGTFKLSSTLEIDLSKHGYCALRGSSATKLVMTAAGPAIRIRGSHFKSADPGGFAPQVWQAERMPTITELAIEGAHAEADGIEAVGTMQLTVSRVHLRKLRHGIHLVENNRNLLIDACHIYENSGIGVFYDQVNLHLCHACRDQENLCF